MRSIEYEMNQGRFASRIEAVKTTPAALLNRYLKECTPLRRGAGPEACRIRRLKRHPLAKRRISIIR
ncbi:MAG: hypothetical protein OEN51_02000, partial [Gammaproteobacteria bacterium]|nr:hypothetical protein [Gammaproteobacteria bacterium]